MNKRVIYVAKMKYGTPCLIRLQVTGETEKQFQRDYEDEAVPLVGSEVYFGRRVSKKGLNWFDTLDAAATELYALTLKRKRSLMDCIEQIDDYLSLIEDFR